MVRKFDGDFNLIMSSGDPTGTVTDGEDAYDYPTNLTIDSTYLYVHDLFNDRIVKRLKSDLSFVSEYVYYVDGAYIPGEIQGNPGGIYCDGTYVYMVLLSGTNRLHRLTASDMTYLDGFSDSTDLYAPWGCCVGFGPDIATDGDCSGGTLSAGAGWTHDAGNDEYDATACSGDLTDAGILTSGKRYRVKIVVANYSTGSFRPELGGLPGASIGSNGTHYQYVTAGGADLVFDATVFTGSIQSYEVREHGPELYVTEKGTLRGHIDVFDKTDLAAGLQDTLWDGWVAGDYLMDNPYGVAVDGEYIYVTDTHDRRYGDPADDHRLCKIRKSDGALILTQDVYEIDDVEVDMEHPLHVAVDKDYVYVTDGDVNYAIAVFNKGDLSFEYSDVIGAKNGYSIPWGICVYYPNFEDAEGNPISDYPAEPQVWPM
jgi:hypothetical protein